MSKLITDIHNHEPNTTEFGGNPVYRGVEWRSTYDPKEHVYVFNISARTFPNFGKLNRQIPGVRDDDPTTVMIGEKTIPGRENERYHFFTAFPQPLLIFKPDDQANMVGYVEQDAVRYVVDLINPDNLTRTLDFQIPQDRQLSIGTDLSRQGVFFSMTNPPQQEDIRKAYDRMENYYNKLMETARTLELTDKAALATQLAGNPDYSYAATYFNMETSWNKRQVRPVECANCGESKPAGRKFHQTSFGSLCIEQSVDGWKSAVNSGVKRLEDVPPDFSWVKAKEKQPVAT